MTKPYTSISSSSKESILKADSISAKINENEFNILRPRISSIAMNGLTKYIHQLVGIGTDLGYTTLSDENREYVNNFQNPAKITIILDEITTNTPDRFLTVDLGSRWDTPSSYTMSQSSIPNEEFEYGFASTNQNYTDRYYGQLVSTGNLNAAYNINHRYTTNTDVIGSTEARYRSSKVAYNNTSTDAKFTGFITICLPSATLSSNVSHHIESHIAVNYNGGANYAIQQSINGMTNPSGQYNPTGAIKIAFNDINSNYSTSTVFTGGYITIIEEY